MITLLLALSVAAADTTVLARGEAAADTTLLRPGVSLELARHRAATLSAVRYDIRLDVRDSARALGTVAIEVSRAAGAGDLILDFRGLELGAVRANGRTVSPTWRNGHVLVPASVLRAGENRIDADFTAAIAPAGASIIRYHDATDGSTYLYTLLVPADANQLFPSFDQPDLKARVRWRIVTPRGWNVLANGPLEETVAVAGDAIESRFAPSEPISTYLAAFAAGPWAIVEHRGEPAMRLFVRKSRVNEVDADTLLAENAAAYRWLEQYFGVPYPFAKIDLLLAPAFPFGGMEHVGAIFYNENSFIFREPPTPTDRYRRAATIYHEIAHQWFGDFVTMRWFDDLWLKEGFATFMGARVQEALTPEAGAWVRFYLGTRPPAYAVDATSGTVPVWQELPNLDLAKSNYGPIVYNKAPAILKQLEFMVGKDRFRAGVQRFLKTHAYGNATWQQLLEAIGAAAGRDLTSFGEHYMLRAGMPVIETELRIENDRIAELALVQRPARNLPGDRGGWWPGRVQLRLGYRERPDTTIAVTFAGARTTVPAVKGLPAPAYVWANDGDYGYGLFLADTRSATWFLEHLPEVRDPLLRAMGWGAVWDLVREAALAPTDFLDAALAALPRENDENIANALLGRMLTASSRYLQAEAAARVQPRLEQLLLQRAGDQTLSYGLRKAAFDALLANARTQQGRTVLRAYLDGSRSFEGKPIAQVSRWVAVRRLVALGETDAAALIDRETQRDTTPERTRAAYIARAAVPDQQNKDRYFDGYLNDPALNEEWVTASLGAFNDPMRPELTLRYLRPALEKAEWIRDHRRIFFLPRWLESFIEGQSTAEALRIVDDFLNANPALSIDVRRKILQSRDELERTVRIRGNTAAAPGADGR